MPLRQPKKAAVQNGACVCTSGGYPSTVTGHATMTASQKRGTS
ncbi:hypothetical protein [Mesorhizobium sp. M0040]